MNTMTTRTRFFAVTVMLLGVASSSFALLPAMADDFGPKSTVKFGDLNVSSSEGAEVLYARIRAAAYDVCLEFDNRDNISGLVQREHCVNDVILGAVTKVNNPALTAVYGAKTGKEMPQTCRAADNSSHRSKREGNPAAKVEDSSSDQG